jgi:hypothetical protein
MNLGHEAFISDNWIRILGWLPVHPGDHVLIIASKNFPKSVKLPWSCETEVISQASEMKSALYNYIIVTDVSCMSYEELRNFLKKARKNIIRTGKVCLVSQNRLSYRRWNGMRFPAEGNILRARISVSEQLPYTRQELLSAAGKSWRLAFYYLAPTIDFTTELWSDRCLPDKSGYLEDSFYYGYDRIIFHHDYDALGAVYDENLYPEFSDAFLVILSVSRFVHGMPDRIHYSIRRRSCFQTVTEIRGKCVEKRPFKDNAAEHLLNIQSVYSELSKRYKGCPLKWNKILKTEGTKTRFEFIEGLTLEQQLDQLLKTEKIEKIQSCIEEYFNSFSTGQTMEKFSLTEEFEKVFGRQKDDDILLLSGQDSLQITDIDCIFGNALVRSNAFEITDYEWTFRFPIPFEYVKWRCIHYYLNYREERKTILGEKLYDWFSINERRRRLYLRMEESFQKYVMGSDGIYQQSIKSRGSVLNVTRLFDIWGNVARAGGVRIYYDRGSGFTETDSIETEPHRKNNDQWCIDIKADTDVKGIRIDPASAQGILIVYELTLDGIDDLHDNSGRLVFTNLAEISFKNHVRAFLTKNGDPQVIIKDIENSHISFVYRFMSTVEAEYDQRPLDFLNSGNIEGTLS